MISCVVVVLNGTNRAWPQADQAFSSVRFTGSCGYKFEPRSADIRFVITNSRFIDPGQSPYILTRLIRTLKSFFVSVSMKIAETFPNVSLSTGSLNN